MAAAITTNDQWSHLRVSYPLWLSIGALLCALILFSLTFYFTLANLYHQVLSVYPLLRIFQFKILSRCLIIIDILIVVTPDS